MCTIASGSLGHLHDSKDLECFGPPEKSSPRLAGGLHGVLLSVRGWGWEGRREGGKGRGERELAGAWGPFSFWTLQLQES